MIKTASIIGSNGYLGKNLTIFLKSKGIILYCYDIHITSIISDVEYNTVDISEKDQVGLINTDVDALFMFAGITGTDQSFTEYEKYIDVNVKGLLHVLDHLRNKKSKAKLIFPSTRLIYKGKTNTPLVEEAEKESKTIYAATKAACEDLLKTYHDVFGLNFVIFRICVPYGDLIPGLSSYGTIGFFMKKALAGENIVLYGNGEQKRTFTHVYDICSVMFEIIGKEGTLNETYNIGGETFGLNQIALLIAEKFSVKVDYIPWPEFAQKIESGDTIFDNRKIANVLPNHSFKKLDDWLSEN
jgi:UDP-glucose 4-epimerase